MARSIGALGETQAKLARETKALDAKVGTAPEFPPELMGRLAKLEEALGAATAADPAAQSPQVAALTGKLAELDKAARNATELARSASPASTASWPTCAPTPAVSPSGSTP